MGTGDISTSVPALPRGKTHFPAEVLDASVNVSSRKLEIPDRIATSKGEDLAVTSDGKIVLAQGKSDLGGSQISFPPLGPAAYVAEMMAIILSSNSRQMDVTNKLQQLELDQYVDQALKAAAQTKEATLADAHMAVASAICSGVTALGSFSMAVKGFRDSTSLDTQLASADENLLKATTPEEITTPVADLADNAEAMLSGQAGGLEMEALTQPAPAAVEGEIAIRKRTEQTPEASASTEEGAATEVTEKADKRAAQAKATLEKERLKSQRTELWNQIQMLQQTFSSFVNVGQAIGTTITSTSKAEAQLEEKTDEVQSQKAQQYMSQFSDSWSKSLDAAMNIISAMSQLYQSINATSQKIAG